MKPSIEKYRSTSDKISYFEELSSGFLRGAYNKYFCENSGYRLKIDRFADDIAEAYGYSIIYEFDDPVDPGLCAQSGIIYGKIDFESKEITIDCRQDNVVDNTKRFTIGHELKHMIEDESVWLKYGEAGWSQELEWDANIFARVLILEKDRFKNAFNKLYRHYGLEKDFLFTHDRHTRVRFIIQNLSWLFGISGISIANRMKDLEIYDSPSNIQKFFLDGRPHYYQKEFPLPLLKTF